MSGVDLHCISLLPFFKCSSFSAQNCCSSSRLSPSSTVMAKSVFLIRLSPCKNWITVVIFFFLSVIFCEHIMISNEGFYTAWGLSVSHLKGIEASTSVFRLFGQWQPFPSVTIPQSVEQQNVALWELCILVVLSFLTSQMHHQML